MVFSSLGAYLGKGIGRTYTCAIQVARDYRPNMKFVETVDDAVMSADYDAELADGLKWIDGEAWKSGIDFYEMMGRIASKSQVEEGAGFWAKGKSGGTLK